MTRDRMSELMRQIGWTSGEVSRRLGVRETSSRQMLQGKRNIPNNLGDWLEDIAARIQAAPALPNDWREIRNEDQRDEGQ